MNNMKLDNKKVEICSGFLFFISRKDFYTKILTLLSQPSVNTVWIY